MALSESARRHGIEISKISPRFLLGNLGLRSLSLLLGLLALFYYRILFLTKISANRLSINHTDRISFVYSRFLISGGKIPSGLFKRIPHFSITFSRISLGGNFSFEPPSGFAGRFVYKYSISLLNCKSCFGFKFSCSWKMNLLMQMKIKSNSEL